MKKLIFTGVVVLIAVLFVTCDEFFPTGEKVEYTDVVYSEDGSRVTIYLDGVGVPVTKEQRAMSTRLSKMAYDYLDVVFLNNASAPTVIARAQWDLGQSAGISGVDRGADVAPPAVPGITYDSTKALLAVGYKNGKTLLGIGEIGYVDTYTGAYGTNGFPSAPNSFVTPATQSVTFFIESVKTGLLVTDEAVVTDSTPDANDYGIVTNSFNNDGSASAIWAKSSRQKLGSSYVPAYPLPLPSTTATPATTAAKYTFYGAPEKYKTALKYPAGANAAKLVLVEPRFPRYMDNGRYRQISATIDMMSKVVATQPATVTTAFTNVVDLTFTSIGSGIFSFYIEIPVYVLATGIAADKSTNAAGGQANGLDPIKWRIRTGVGSELYSLDDGAAGGGCVLMTIGNLSLEDWLEINWEWLD